MHMRTLRVIGVIVALAAVPACGWSHGSSTTIAAAEVTTTTATAPARSSPTTRRASTTATTAPRTTAAPRPTTAAAAPTTTTTASLDTRACRADPGCPSSEHRTSDPCGAQVIADTSGYLEGRHDAEDGRPNHVDGGSTPAYEQGYAQGWCDGGGARR